jgi:hypothetical protein
MSEPKDLSSILLLGIGILLEEHYVTFSGDAGGVQRIGAVSFRSIVTIWQYYKY